VVHATAYNLGVILRALFGVGTPRSLQGRATATCAALVVMLRTPWQRFATHATCDRDSNDLPTPTSRVQVVAA